MFVPLEFEQVAVLSHATVATLQPDSDDPQTCLNSNAFITVNQERPHSEDGFAGCCPNSVYCASDIRRWSTSTEKRYSIFSNTLE